MRGCKSLAVACLAVFSAVPMYPATPKLFPNSTKYRDAGAKPAFGRSGSAAIEVRALRGPARTDIEVTTGQIDSATAPPGRLDKVQVKVFAPTGALLVTDNYRKGLVQGGYGDFAYDWVSPGQSVQVQANVSGIDPTRTDIVTVGTSVKLRPDLAVSDLTNPSLAKMNATVAISATVREINHDTGARANCVLRADGVEVDRANGIWVDAGDSVACEFTHRFDSTGVKQLTVEATGVVPGDYDTSNNSVAGQINVVGAGVPVRYTIGAYDIKTDGFNGTRHLDSYRYDDHPDWDWSWQSSSTTDSSDHIVSYQAQMFFDRRVAFPLRVDSSLTSDGQIVVQDSQMLDVTSSYGDASYQTQCGVTVFDFDHPRSFQVCSTTLANGDGYSSVSTWTQSRLLTYYSTQTSIFRAYGIEDVYSQSWDTRYEYGQQPVPSLGNHISVQAAVIDANSVNDVDASVDLLPIPDSIIPLTEECSTWDETWGTEHYSGYDCYSYGFHTYGRQGFATGVDQQ